jgi:hypothetical protein
LQELYLKILNYLFNAVIFCELMCALLIPRSSLNESEEAPSIGSCRYTRSMTLSPFQSFQKADFIQRANRDDCGFISGSFLSFIFPNFLNKAGILS